MRRTIGQNITYYREYWGLTKTELARRCDISDSQIGKYERDESDMQLFAFLALCEALEVTPNELVGWEDKKRGKTRSVPKRETFKYYTR